MDNQNGRTGGGQPGNVSAVRAGTRTERYGMVLSVLGDRFTTVYQNVKKLRRSLESHVLEHQGALSLESVGRINQACRWELTARICLRLVAADDTLPHGEVVSLLNSMGQATARRDSLIRQLAVDGDGGAVNPFDALYTPPVPGEDRT